MAIKPYDEPEISHDDDIIRRVNPEQHVVFDERIGQNRLSSKLFSPSSGPEGGMSVDIAELIEKSGNDVCDYVTTPVFTGAVKFKACVAREVGLMIGYDPLPNNPCHGEVWNSSARPNRFSTSQKKALFKEAEWLVPLSGVKIDS